MKLQRLLNLSRKAVEEYQMIQDGDRIAIGVSGGKDSLTLLYALAGLRKFYPHPFELHAISVDLGYQGFDLSPVRELCESLEVPYTIVPTQIGEIITVAGRESHPCSLCAKLRRGALHIGEAAPGALLYLPEVIQRKTGIVPTYR